MCDVLVGTNNNDATMLPVNAAHFKNVVASLQVRAKHFLIVAKSITAFLGKEERGHVLQPQVTMFLLEDRSHINYRVDIRLRRRESTNRRFWGIL